jgi:hypothetical protein
VPYGLNDRACDNWSPLLAIADLAGGEWPQRARAAALDLSGAGRDDEQDVPVGMEAAKRSRTLEDQDGCGVHGLASGLCGEVAHQRVDEAADLSVKLLVVAKECTEHLGNGEDELAVGQPKQELLVHVLAQQEGPLL